MTLMMGAETFKGTISFINYEKQYYSIEYFIEGKKRKINGRLARANQLTLPKENGVKPVHRFLVGDQVKFLISRLDKNGKLVADHVQYLYNDSLSNLIQKATTENRFAGYLKQVGDNLFVKETGSYLMFPLKLSLWENKPGVNKINEPVLFKLENLHNPAKLNAVLFNPVFIPAFLKARQLFLNKTPIEAVVYNVTLFAIYINIIGEEVQAKIVRHRTENNIPLPYKAGDTIKVIITFLSSTKIVVVAV